MHRADQFVGVDGCKAGWFFVALSGDEGQQFGASKHFVEVVALVPQASLILVDIPIGLPGRDYPTRRCDSEARRAITPRGSTVFPAPAREAVSKDSYAAASAENNRVLGRKLSRQSWAIVPKIIEVDTFIRQVGGFGMIREMHPEVAFWALNDRQPLRTNKKTKEGFEERIAVLSRHFAEAEICYEGVRREYRRTQVQDDDILDAMVGAVTARYAGQLKTLPELPSLDQQGLPMEIVYADLSCPFCASNVGRVHFADGLIRAMPDAYPISPGHTLIVPRRHIETWFEATEQEKIALFAAIDRVRDFIERDHQPTAYNIGINSGRDAGQTVPHLHLHVIPRYPGDIDDPRGGIRNILPDRARWWEQK